MDKQHRFGSGIGNQEPFAYRCNGVRLAAFLHGQFALTLVFLTRFDVGTGRGSVQFRERSYGEIQRMRLTRSGSADKSHEQNRALVPFSFEPGEMGVADTEADSH